MKRVLVTGASGHLGRKLFDYLEQLPEYDVHGLDIRPADHPNIYIADFSTEGDWAERFKNTDTIVHLAGDREPSATWESAINNNMDATLRLYHYAVAQGVKRVVLASSNWLHGGRRFGNERLTTVLPPYPVNAYGMSKLFCERTGAYFAEHHGLSVICLRIGWTQWTHNNKPGKHMAMGNWGQEMWLSDRDFFNGMQCAIDAENIKFEILNLMSDNPNMRWDIERTKKIIGYKPKDGHYAALNAKIKIRSAAIEYMTRKLPGWLGKTFPDW